MEILPKFVDMAQKPSDTSGMMVSGGNAPMYSYRQCISFNQEDLEKLNMDTEVEPGDMIHLEAIGRVTSVSKQENMDGTMDCRVEIQLTHIKPGDTHEDIAEESHKVDYSKFYS